MWFLKKFYNNYSPKIIPILQEESFKGQNKHWWMDFKGIRDYVSGDNPKFIFWKSYAQNKKLTTKIFDDIEEKPLNIYIHLSPTALFNKFFLNSSEKKIFETQKTILTKMDYMLSYIFSYIAYYEKKRSAENLKINFILFSYQNKEENTKIISTNNKLYRKKGFLIMEEVKKFYQGVSNLTEKEIKKWIDFETSITNKKILKLIQKKRRGIEEGENIFFTDNMNLEEIDNKESYKYFIFIDSFEYTFLQKEWFNIIRYVKNLLINKKTSDSYKDSLNMIIDELNKNKYSKYILKTIETYE